MSRLVKIATAALCALSLAITLTSATNVYADGGWIGTGSGSSSGGGGGGAGGTCNSSYNRYTISCAGVSWMYYEATDTVISDVSFPYVKNVLGSVRATIPSVCGSSEYGGFWHFGINAINAGWTGSTIAFGTAYGSGHWISETWGTYASGYYSVPYKRIDLAPYNNILNQKVGPYTPVRTGTEEEVLAAYKEAYARAYPGVDTSSITSLPNDLYAFCYWGEGQLYAQSAVYVEGKAWANTNVVSSYTEKKTETVKVTPGAAITVGFSHNPYARSKTDNVSYGVRLGGPSGGYTVTSRNFDNSADRAGVVNLDTLADNGHYTVASRPYHNGNYSINEAFTLVFSDAAVGKEYEFCEIYSLNGSDKTRVCAVLEVENDEKEEDTDPELCESWKNETENYTKSDSMEGWTEVINKIKNNSLSNRNSGATYSGWRRDITYAKPTDNITWTNCYYPGVQEVANTEVTYDHKEHSGGNNTNGNAGYSNSVFGTWENKFSVTPSTASSNWASQNGAFVSISNPFTFATGNTAIQSESNNYNIRRVNDVSYEFDEKIETGIPTWAKVAQVSGSTHRWGCCGEACTACHYHTNLYGTGQRSNDKKSDNAKVIVPYNFTNSAGLDFSSSNSVLYAGETVNVTSAWVNVGKKSNDLTKDNYTTQVDEARVKLMGYVTTNPNVDARRVSGSVNDDICAVGTLLGDYQKQCEVFADTDDSNGKKTVLNPNGELGGMVEYNGERPSGLDGTIAEMNFSSTSGSFSGVYNVFDASAGDYFCMVMAVWPSASGEDKNTEPDGDKQWYISKPVCRVIAKRPSLQVLGGSVYSTGNINTSMAAKTNIYGAYGYMLSNGKTNGFDTSGEGNGTIFGSWAEQSIVNNAITKGMASGAGTGLADSQTGSGSLEHDNSGYSHFCDNRTSLSLANYGKNAALSPLRDSICPGKEIVGYAGVNPVTTNRAALVDYWSPNKDAAKLSGTVGLGDIMTSDRQIVSATGKNIFYAEGGDNLTLDRMTIGANTTIIIKAGGGLTLGGDIIYTDGQMSSSGEIPKVVIYSSGDVTIECGVHELDAIIIAEKNVNTCSGYSGNTDSDLARRSEQLTVRGVIISNSLIPSRTYGAAASKGAVVKGIVEGGSATPAEVVNYDTSAILWGRYMASAAESDTLTVTYQHELAPRY